MSELKWLDNYSGQTTEELIALEGEFRTDSIVLAFEQALDQKDVRLGEISLAEEELVVLAIETLEREVNNGGYHQFFINASKAYPPIIVAALNRIDCTETAKLTQQAIDILEIEGAVTIEAIEAVIYEDDEARDVRLGECDDQYFENAGDLSDPLFEFIKNNRDKIILKD